jgi:hypothetical protein
LMVIWDGLGAPSTMWTSAFPAVAGAGRRTNRHDAATTAANVLRT